MQQNIVAPFCLEGQGSCPESSKPRPTKPVERCGEQNKKALRQREAGLESRAPHENKLVSVNLERSRAHLDETRKGQKEMYRDFARNSCILTPMPIGVQPCACTSNKKRPRSMSRSQATVTGSHQYKHRSRRTRKQRVKRSRNFQAVVTMYQHSRCGRGSGSDFGILAHPEAPFMLR